MVAVDYTVYVPMHDHLFDTQVQRAEVLYWKVDCPERFTTDVFPLLVYEDVETMDKFYVFPIHEYPGLIKVNFSSGKACKHLSAKKYFKTNLF